MFYKVDFIFIHLGLLLTINLKLHISRNSNLWVSAQISNILKALNSAMFNDTISSWVSVDIQNHKAAPTTAAGYLTLNSVWFQKMKMFLRILLLLLMDDIFQVKCQSNFTFYSIVDLLSILQLLLLLLIKPLPKDGISQWNFSEYFRPI